VSILLDSGQVAKLKVTVNGSDEGFSVKAERASDPEATATADASDFLTQDGETLYFNPGHNYTGANVYYRITVTSDEVGSKTVINFEHGFEKEPEPVILPSEEMGDESGTDAGSGDGAESADGAGSAAESGADSGSDSETA
jgi:hypothetical protein